MTPKDRKTITEAERCYMKRHEGERSGEKKNKTGERGG